MSIYKIALIKLIYSSCCYFYNSNHFKYDKLYFLSKEMTLLEYKI